MRHLFYPKNNLQKLKIIQPTSSCFATEIWQWQGTCRQDFLFVDIFIHSCAWLVRYTAVLMFALKAVCGGVCMCPSSCVYQTNKVANLLPPSARNILAASPSKLLCVETYRHRPAFANNLYASVTEMCLSCFSEHDWASSLCAIHYAYVITLWLDAATFILIFHCVHFFRWLYTERLFKR